MTARPDLDKLPAVKFFKSAVEDILSGAKTLEPRPRSTAWIKRLETSDRARLTYGPRMGAPTVFAVARILDVVVRAFETATQEDVDRIGSDWKGRDPVEFIAAYTDWYRKELDKGYLVAWISFEVDEDAMAP
ncbi:MAG: hypothetical protein ACRDYA_20595 [Egibacteraceae bacterium]